MKQILILILIIFLISSVDNNSTESQDVQNKVETENQTDTENSDVNVDYDNESFDIQIKGLGDVSQSTLLKAKKIVENFYGFKCVVKSNIDIESNMYKNQTDTIDGDFCLDNIDVNKKTIYITDNPLFGSNLDLRGYTKLNGRLILIKSGSHLQETLIHEIGHTLGLSHCDDLSCIMAINNDEYDSGDFCDKCKRIINP